MLMLTHAADVAHDWQNVAHDSAKPAR